MAEKVKGITIEFRGNATPLQKAIRQVDSELNKTTKELSAVNKALKFNPSNVDLWKQKQELLKQKISETEDKLSALKQAQKQMDAAGVDKNSEEYRKLQREIVEAESKLKTFNKQLKEIGNANLKALSEGFKKVGDDLTKVGKDLSMKVTAPLVAIGAVSAKSFAEVDKTMQLTNKTMGNTTEQADMLNKAMKDAAANSVYGMSDAATATLNFARAGLDAEQAAAALAPAMNLAAGEGGDLDTVSAGLVATINGFQGSFEEASTYADIFANACNNSALDVDSLASSMSTAAPVFNAAGYTVKDAALYMGVMANNGIEASEAANSLKTGFARLISPAKQGAEMMADLGLYTDEGGSAFENLDGSMKSTVEIQKILHDSFSKLSESEQIAAASAIFGKNQMSKWLALINTAPEDVAALNEQLETEGTVTEMANAMMSGFGGSLEKLKSSVDVAKVSLGEALAPAILLVANGIQSLVDWFNNLSPHAQSAIATIGIIVASIGPLLVILGVLASSIGSILGVVATIGPAIAAVGGAITALTSGPLLLIVAAIAAVIAIGVLLYKNWDTIKAKATELWTKLKEVFAGIKNSIVTTWNSIKTAISTKINEIKTKVLTTFESIREGIKNKIIAIKDAIVDRFRSIKETVAGVVDGIKEKIGGAWDWIKEKTSGAWDTIVGYITAPFERAWDTISGIVDWIRDLFPIDLSNFFGNIKLPHFSWDWIDIGGIISIPSINIDWYKKGGIFSSPTIAGLGEAGSEAVVPLDKFWDKMDKIAEASTGGGITINVYGTAGMNEEELARKVEQKLVAWEKQRSMAYGGI